MLKKFLPRTLQVRMILSFAVIMVFIILTISYTLYVNFEKIGVKLVSNANLNTLSKESFSAVYMNEAAKNFSVSLFSDTANLALMYNTDENNFEVDNQIKNLTNLISGIPFVHF